MALILNLETATKTCSVALGVNGESKHFLELTEAQFSHAENLNPFIEKVMAESGYTLAQLEAVAISSGPGSYTGLRIGTSTAKGLCYALDIPLLSISTLEALAVGALERANASGLVCSMIDARRMEVYASLYDQQGGLVRDVQADIVTVETYAEYLDQGLVTFCGDGADKTRTVIEHENARWESDVLPSARFMSGLAEKRLEKGQIEDTAYFEPFYLKNFQAVKPKHPLQGLQ